MPPILYMSYMKFYNRERELEFIRKHTRVAVLGRRRVGKTRLVEEGLENYVKLFVPRDKSKKLIARDWIREIRESGIFMPDTENLTEILEFLFRQDVEIFIDEVQNLLKVDKSLLWDLQRLVDKYKGKKVVITGSYISSSKKMLLDYKSPLFGRFVILRLRELEPRVVFQILSDLGYDIEDSFKFWSVLGGIPKYYEVLEREGCPPEEFFRKYFLEYPRPFSEEIRMMLKEELGKEYKHYFSIIEAISVGSNTMKRISEYTGIKMESLSRYLNDLLREYEIVGRIKSFYRRKSLYYIRSNDVNFWARFFWKNIEKIETLEERDVIEEFSKEIGSYYSRAFERFCMDVLREMGYGKISKDWKEGEYEIDIIAEKEGVVHFFEVKFSKVSQKEYKRLKENLKALAKRLGVNTKPVVISWDGKGDIVLREYIEKNWLK